MKHIIFRKTKIYRFASILIMIMLMCNISLPVYAAEGGSCGADLQWSLFEGILTISGKGEMTDYKDGDMAPWHEYAEEIVSVSLPSGLTSIGDLAFSGCSNLTNISIPQNVTSIGDYAFADCSKLSQMNLGTVENIGDGAFYECEALSSISIPGTVISIGSKAFYRCYELKMVTVPSSVTSMGVSVFGYCEGLVRAVVNAPLNELPVWTFYGCTSLTDVSLAPQTTSVGEYAFQHCENLNGIYLQGGDENVATEIDKSIGKEQEKQQDVTNILESDLEIDQSADAQTEDETLPGANEDQSIVDPFVATHDMPNSSTVVTNGAEQDVSVTVVQKDDLSVSVTDIIDYTDKEIIHSRVVQATVQNSEEWSGVVEVVEEEIENQKTGKITVEIQLTNTKVTAEELVQYAGKDILLNLKLANGIIWKLDMSEFSEENFSGIYEFGTEVSKVDAEKTSISSENVYTMKFAGKIDFNVSVGVNLGKQYDTATLFVKDSGNYNLINTMIVDYDNYAWFSLAGVSKGTKYFIGLNVDKIKFEDATIPNTMYHEYGLEEDGSYLMDKDGMQYRITGRSSRWGITLGQFMSYVIVAMLAVVLIVAVVMITMNILKRSREKYERMAEEEALKEKEEEEALRLEIMKELLGESSDKSK